MGLAMQSREEVGTQSLHPGWVRVLGFKGIKDLGFKWVKRLRFGGLGCSF